MPAHTNIHITKITISDIERFSLLIFFSSSFFSYIVHTFAIVCSISMYVFLLFEYYWFCWVDDGVWCVCVFVYKNSHLLQCVFVRFFSLSLSSHIFFKYCLLFDYCQSSSIFRFVPIFVPLSLFGCCCSFFACWFYCFCCCYYRYNRRRRHRFSLWCAISLIVSRVGVCIYLDDFSDFSPIIFCICFLARKKKTFQNWQRFHLMVSCCRRRCCCCCYIVALLPLRANKATASILQSESTLQQKSFRSLSICYSWVFLFDSSWKKIAKQPNDDGKRILTERYLLFPLNC